MWRLRRRLKKIGVLVVREPLAFVHELVAEIPQMRRRPAEGGQAEAGEYAQHLGHTWGW